MHDHTSGQKRDARSLNDLRYSVIRVSCQGCNHSNLRYPIDLKRYADPNHAWVLLIPTCSICGVRDAIAEAHPLPR